MYYTLGPVPQSEGLSVRLLPDHVTQVAGSQFLSTSTVPRPAQRALQKPWLHVNRALHNTAPCDSDARIIFVHADYSDATAGELSTSEVFFFRIYTPHRWDQLSC